MVLWQPRDMRNSFTFQMCILLKFPYSRSLVRRKKRKRVELDEKVIIWECNWKVFSLTAKFVKEFAVSDCVELQMNFFLLPHSFTVPSSHLIWMWVCMWGWFIVLLLFNIRKVEQNINTIFIINIYFRSLFSSPRDKRIV